MKWLIAILVVAGCTDERSRPDAEPATGTVHPTGFADQNSENFHVYEIERLGYDLKVCMRCHGDDFAGGKAGKTCLSCHPQGPTACVTCHGPAGPTSGNHPVHLVDAQLGCNECHVVPTAWDSPNHTGSVEVTFGAKASIKTTPVFENGQCTVYCHLSERPVWTDPPVRGCDRCHGAPPPPTHPPFTQCASCHPTGDAHIDGTVEVPSACDGCHGNAGDPAPPRDLSGNLFITSIGVGAHQAHLRAKSGISAPIPCDICHLVPATVTAAGHLDSPAPAEVASGLGWDRTTQTCATAWCHRGPSPKWTEAGGAFCGSCHGVPPATASHDASMNVSSCAGCHPAGFVKHIDGVLDVL